MPQNKVLLEVAAKVDEAVKGFDQIKGQMLATASEAEDLRAVLAGMQQSFSGNNSALGGLTSALAQLESAVNTLIHALQEFRDSAKNAFKQAGQGAKTLGRDVKGAVKDIRSAQAKSVLDLGQIRSGTAGTGDAVLDGSDFFDPELILREAGEIGAQASAEFVRYFKAAQDAAQEQMWRGAGKSIVSEDLIKGYENFSNITKKWCETQLKRVAAVITTIGGTISGVVKSALDVGGGFETQMTRVKIISGATGEELDLLTKKAREMGESLPITAQEAAAAMELMAQRGTKAHDILASVVDVSNLAISQNVDMASAAELLGSTMTNFGIAVEDASKVTDIFNNASNQSALSMSKLSESLKYVAPVAATAGMSLEQTIAAMEVLGNAGLGGEMIGTGLSMTLQKLAENSKILGVRTREANGNLRPLKDIFGELQARGMNLAQATEIFGARASKAALNLAKYSHTLSENEANLQKWGSTQNAVTEQMGTWTNVKKALESAFEGVQLEIFDQIAADSKTAALSITELTKEVRKWISETGIATKTVRAFAEGLGLKIPTSDGLKSFLESFDVDLFLKRITKFGETARDGVSVISYFVKRFLFFIRMLLPWLDKFVNVTFWAWWIGNAAGLIANFMKFANVLGKAAAIIKAFPVTTLPKIITFLTTLSSIVFSPIGAIVAGVAAVGGAAYYLYNRSSKAEAAERERERLEEELEAANKDAVIEVELNIKTGFEELPKAYESASDDVREKIDSDVKFLQDAFKDKIAQAIEDVNAGIEEMGERFDGVAEDISDSLAQDITKALQGNEAAFKKLPEYWQKVTERLVEMGVEAGRVTGNIHELIAAHKQAQEEAQRTRENSLKSEYTLYSENLARTIDAILTEFPAKVEKATEFLGGKNVDLAVRLQLDAARSELKEFVGEAAKEYSLPEEIIETGLLERLKTLASQNNQTAQSLINGWNGAKDKVSDFINSAKEAIQYLGASPAQFLPALNSLMANIQKINPITGKVTEAFKKGRDTLKEWASVTFDKLSERIKRLRKAVEGGFVDRRALENEFKEFSKELKLQVVTELEPTKGLYKDERAFEGVVASEYMSRLGEIGGDALAAKAKEEFARSAQWTGQSIGHAILTEIERERRGITTQEKPQNNVQETSKPQEQDVAQTLINSLTPLISKMESAQSGQASAAQDMTGTISPLTSVIQTLTSGLETARESVADNTAELETVQDVLVSAQDSMLSMENTLMAFEEVFLSAEDAIHPMITGLEEQLRQYSAAQGREIPDYAADPALPALTSALISTRDSIESNRAALEDMRGTLILVKDAFTAGPGEQRQQKQDIAQAVTEGLTPLVARLEQIQAAQVPAQNTGASLSASDIQALVSDLAVVRAAITSNTSALDGTGSELASVDSALQRSVTAIEAAITALKSVSASPTYSVEIHQHGFVIQSKSDADMTARAAVDAFRTGIGNGSV